MNTQLRIFILAFGLNIFSLNIAYAQIVTVHHADENGVVDDASDPTGDMLDSAAVLQTLADPQFDQKKGMRVYSELEKTDTVKAEKTIADHEEKALSARREYEQDPVKE